MSAGDKAKASVNAIAAFVDSLGGGPMFVHSDPFSAARLVEPSRNKKELLDRHIALLLRVAGERPLWIPAFNYDFPRTGVFDVAADPAQIGPIPEHFRTRCSKWRTDIPVFSIAGIGNAPSAEFAEHTDPFGDDSAFAELVRQEGVILYYGNTFHFNTIVHYAERLAGGPPYRYDKIFPGVVRHADRSESTGSLNYHVRPLGSGLDYDWPAILDRALAADATRRLAEYPEILAASARRLVAFLVEEMRADPLALLDAKSRKWVGPALDELGRRFVISDFESAEPFRATRVVLS
jgi:aminoglycoside 3-N-acetyltransferase